jgi:hypothetical protein
MGCEKNYTVRSDFKLPDGWAALLVTPGLVSQGENLMNAKHDKVLCPYHAWKLNEFLE